MLFGSVFSFAASGSFGSFVAVRASRCDNEFMARGWESKSVEEQITAAEDKQHDKDKAAVTASDIERRKRRQGLLLERARITREMEQSHKKRYLVLLERALAHIDAEIAKLEPPAAP
jgi:hypothetical protein